MNALTIAPDRDIFHYAFEERFRGTRAQVKAQMQPYLPFALPFCNQQDARAFDLGCGRGEWLEILRELGFAVSGVERDPVKVATCQMYGLEVEQRDALETLQSLQSNSQSLITAFRLIEHLSFEKVRLLVSESLRVLKPGGLLILESLNPENFIVASATSSLAPNPIKTFTPELIEFIVDYEGFFRQVIARFQQNPVLNNPAALSFIEMLSGVSPTYALIAQKNATTAELAGFDGLFTHHYGAKLNELIRLFNDEQERSSKASAQSMESWVTYVKNSLAQNMKRSDYLENRLVSDVDRITQRSDYLENRLVSDVDRITQRSDYLENRLVIEMDRVREYSTYLKDELINQVHQNTQRSLDIENQLAKDSTHHSQQYAELESRVILESERINAALAGLYYQLEPLRIVIRFARNLEYRLNRLKHFFARVFRIRLSLRAVLIETLKKLRLDGVARSWYFRFRSRSIVFEKVAASQETHVRDAPNLTRRTKLLADQLKQKIKKTQKDT